MENKLILDKILETNQASELTRFSPSDLITSLFANLSNREQEVLKKRHALAGSARHTLDKIGKDLNVTRERVRQIELSSIKKVKTSPNFVDQVRPAEKAICYVLENHGGLMEQEHLLENLLEFSGNQPANRFAVAFILSQMLNDKFHFILNHPHFNVCWKLPRVNEDQVLTSVNQLVNLVKEYSEPIPHGLLAEKVGDSLNEAVLFARLRASKLIKNNVFGHWGLKDWNTITPKRINDKIFLVLKDHGKPLHFTEIAKRINQLRFDDKVAYPATVHNELILDKKYVLVGRGIYALAEWGYKPGVVADVIADVISSVGRPMTREEIVQKVLDQRMVGKSTIHLALMNKERFSKLADGRYQLGQSSKSETA